MEQTPSLAMIANATDQSSARTLKLFIAHRHHNDAQENKPICQLQRHVLRLKLEILSCTKTLWKKSKKKSKSKI